MDWLRLSIVVLTLSSITWSFECPEGPNCSQCEQRKMDMFEVQCNITDDESRTNHGGSGDARPYGNAHPGTLPLQSNEDRHTSLSDFEWDLDWYSDSYLNFHVPAGEVAFMVTIQPSKLVNIICRGYPNWTDFHLGAKNPIKHVAHIYFYDCNLPQTGFAAVTKQLLADEISDLSFYSLQNGITSLTRETFRGLNNLQKLTLRDGGLLNLSDDVLEDYENLPYVDVSANDSEKVPENFFGHLNLRTTTLVSKWLKTFEVDTFDQLSNLKELSICHINLRNLLPHTFDGLISLVSLNMGENFLKLLPDGIFKKMRHLTSIDLSQNNFTGEALPEDLFKDNVELQWVTMGNNKRNMTRLPNGFFANLTKLYSVELEWNGLIYLPKDLFSGTTNLWHVSMRGNFLKTLPSEIFKDTTRMWELDLSINNLSDLPDDVFEKLEELDFLDLSVNHLTSVNE